MNIRWVLIALWELSTASITSLSHCFFSSQVFNAYVTSPDVTVLLGPVRQKFLKLASIPSPPDLRINATSPVIFPNHSPRAHHVCTSLPIIAHWYPATYTPVESTCTYRTVTMPPKAPAGGKGRAVQEPSFVSELTSTFTSRENRPVVTAVGLFAVSLLVPCV